MNINYKEIAELINRSEAGIKSMKKNNPEQLEITKLGAICKKYNISLNDLKKIFKEKEEKKREINS
uniref:helix-turn-helix domain-containing protein n=1 Tax=Aliarcobacter sp. TaxID=2321116 RepID=UPI004048968A